MQPVFKRRLLEARYLILSGSNDRYNWSRWQYYKKCGNLWQAVVDRKWTDDWKTSPDGWRDRVWDSYCVVAPQNMSGIHSPLCVGLNAGDQRYEKMGRLFRIR